MTIGIWVLGNQLSREQTALVNFPEAPVILIESLDFAKARPYHRQKLVLVWSAMRHFAEVLRSQGRDVTYAIASDWLSPLQEWLDNYQVNELKIMDPRDRPYKTQIENSNLSCQLSWLPNNHFYWSNDEFKDWASKRKNLVLEDFYRASRQRFQILMEDKKPVGNRWNFDKENRKPPKSNLNPPQVLMFEPDKITRNVIEKVNSLDLPLYGKIEPFNWGVTREEAQAVLEHFLTHTLAKFGPYQDAMVTGEPTLFHSLISPYLNIGLITPQEVVDRAETVYDEGDIPLNSVEGFIRQILGWREYLQGIYSYVNEDYRQSNWFEHQESLPELYWDATKTQMNCLHQVLTQVETTGYAHHIQRLMILSNFALIVGVSPQEIEDWFHSAFIDAYDWVMQTNVLGMGQFADGGVLASKPYAASANYINRMSDYCSNCVYNYGDRTGDKACPFNFFYWDFLRRHQSRLKSLGRMNLVLSHLKRFDAQELSEIHELADNWRKQFTSLN